MARVPDIVIKTKIFRLCTLKQPAFCENSKVHVGETIFCDFWIKLAEGGFGRGACPEGKKATLIWNE